MTMTVTLKMDNAAFCDDGEPGTEAARILRDLAEKIEGANFSHSYDRVLRLQDVNGNPVGEMEVTR